MSLTEQHAHNVTRQWLSLTPQQREEIRRQNLRVQELIARCRMQELVERHQEKEERQ